MGEHLVFIQIFAHKSAHVSPCLSFTDLSAVLFHPTTFKKLYREHTSDGDWMIFPNPAKGFTNVRWPAKDNGSDIDLQVLSLQGKVLSRHRMDGTAGNYQLDVSDLPAGIYWLQMNKKDQQLVRKLIVQ